MKRFLLSIVATMLTTMGLMAGHWAGPVFSNYEQSALVIVTPKLNGAAMTSSQTVEIAAFIGDECRGVGNAIEANGKLQMLVYFSSGEAAATLSFKAYYNGAEYTMNATKTLAGENRLDATLNIQVPKSIEFGGANLNLEDAAYITADLCDYLYFYFAGSDDAIAFADLDSYPQVGFTTTDTKHITLSGTTATALESTNARGVKVTATCGTLTSEGYVTVSPIDYEVVGIRFGYVDTENYDALEPQTTFNLDIESAANKKIDFANYIQYQIITGYEMDPTTGKEEIYKDWVALSSEQDASNPYPYLLSIPVTTITIPGYSITAQTVSGKLVYLLAPTEGTGVDGAQITLACTTSTGAKLSNTDSKIYVKPFVISLKTITLTTEQAEIPLFGATTYKLIPEPTNASNFKAEDYLLIATPLTNVPTGWKMVETEGFNNTSNTLDVTGYCIGNYKLTLYKVDGTAKSVYKDNANKEVTTTIKVGAKYQVNSGWDWVSYYYTTTSMNTPAALRAKMQLTEVRSQTEACYWDAEYAQFFGSLKSIEPSTAYKVYSAATDPIELTVFDGTNTIGTKALYKNYTWVGYPYQYDFAATDVLSGLGVTFTNGDKVIGQNASLEYKNGSWAGSLTTFEAGHSYIFYVQKGNGQTLTWKSAAAMGQPLTALEPGPGSMSACAISPWNYDLHAYRDNMTIVAKVEGEGDYLIGAFVGDECRGEGKQVEFNGEKYYFITVHGQSGEQVTFKAFQNLSYADFNTTISFTSMAGSLTHPMMLSGDFQTNGIGHIAAESDGEALCVDLTGRAASTDAHGIYVIRQNGKTRKVVK